MNVSDDLRRLDLRKGLCPGALRPMMAKDGLLVRLRITGGIVKSEVAGAIADLAEVHGNGLFDLSARANLQLRGVDESAMPALLSGLGRLGLLDADAEGEAIRNVSASPLAGLNTAGNGLPRFATKDSPDIRPIVAALENALVHDTALNRLPAKFGFLIDDGSMPTLADVSADVRFDWSREAEAFAVGLGGTRQEAAYAGMSQGNAVVARATEIARQVVALQDGGGPRRMRRILADVGPQAASNLFGVRPNGEIFARSPANGELVGARRFAQAAVLGIAAPFGRLDAGMLRAAAKLGDRELGELRLTPWRTIFVPCTDGTDRESALAAARTAGFITDSTDPRLRIAACTGHGGCERGTTSTHADAIALGDLLPMLALMPSLDNEMTRLHVSGCEKGCAKPYQSSVTLVGRDSRYDLVRDGRPGDPPSLRSLDLAQVRAALLLERELA